MVDARREISLIMINLGLRFLLELGLLVAFGYWGFQANTGLLSWILGIGVPICAAVIWGVWVAPHSKRRLPDPFRLGIEIGLFALGTLALWVAEQQTVALIFGLLVAVNLFLLIRWRQR